MSAVNTEAFWTAVAANVDPAGLLRAHGVSCSAWQALPWQVRLNLVRRYLAHYFGVKPGAAIEAPSSSVCIGLASKIGAYCTVTPTLPYAPIRIRAAGQAQAPSGWSDVTDFGEGMGAFLAIGAVAVGLAYFFEK